jgi:hypothetical protein
MEEGYMSKITLLCVCVLLAALAVIYRIQRLEDGLARAAYSACNGRDASPLKLVRSD